MNANAIVPPADRGNFNRATPTDERDRGFERAMIVARTRWNLEQEARGILLQRDPLAPERLRDDLVFAIVRARPRSRLVAWHQPDFDVEAIVGRVVKDLCR